MVGGYSFVVVGRYCFPAEVEDRLVVVGEYFCVVVSLEGRFAMYMKKVLVVEEIVCLS